MVISQRTRELGRRRLESGVLALCLLLIPAAPALAGDMDGLWVRDDQKTYLIVDGVGLERTDESKAGDYGARLAVKRDAGSGSIEWTIHLTRRADEQGWLETHARSTAAVDPGATKVELEFEWVDLDDAGKEVARGKEPHTLERREAIAEKDRAALRSLLERHAKIDGHLDPAKLDRAAALREVDAGLKEAAGRADFVRGFEQRKKALESGSAAKTAASGPLVDLEPSGIAARLHAPEGAKVKAESWGDVKVTVGEGEHFDITFASGLTDMAAQKRALAKNDVNKLVRYVVEKPDEILYESEVMGTHEFHFMINVKLAGGLEVHAEDTKGPSYSQADVEEMLAAVKSLTTAKK